MAYLYRTNNSCLQRQRYVVLFYLQQFSNIFLFPLIWMLGIKGWNFLIPPYNNQLQSNVVCVSILDKDESLSYICFIEYEFYDFKNILLITFCI